MTTTTATEPTGTQHVLTHGDASATITELAASLRAYSVAGVDLVQPYPALMPSPSSAGIVLMPWPNRVADATWTLDGEPQQLAITEPARTNALHGLLRYSPYTVVEKTEGGVTLGATVFPQHGYPFHLDTTVRYELDDDALRVTHTVHNLSKAKAPVGVGAHPFLTIGDVPTEDIVLTVHASTYFDVDDRLLPLAELPVEGTKYDLRQGGRVGDLELDTAFGEVARQNGASAVLRAPDGRELRLVQDEAHGYVQVFTTRTFPKLDGPGLAVAVEPMTSPPDALNTGLGIHWVAPGETWTVGWGLEYSR